MNHKKKIMNVLRKKGLDENEINTIMVLLLNHIGEVVVEAKIDIINKMKK